MFGILVALIGAIMLIGPFLLLRHFFKNANTSLPPRQQPELIPQPLADALPDKAALEPEQPKPRGKKKSAEPKPPRPKFDLEIVGEHYYQKNLKMLAGNHWPNKAKVECTATLIPEAFNLHDLSAVRVEIGGVPVGHLSRANARAFREWLKTKGVAGKPYEVAARISGGYDRGDKWMEYSVWLDVTAFEK